MLMRIVCLLIGYAFGLFQTGYIIGREKGIDIRTKGSGNSGTTNALRVMGKKAGALVFAGDVLKLLLACFLTVFLFNGGIFHDAKGLLVILYTGFGVVLGHNFPFYMNFKGGKGIAVTAAAFIVLDWRLVLIGLVVFLVSVLLSHYVSLGSILVVVVFFISWVLMGILGMINVSGASLIESSIIVFLWAALAIFRHRSNIVRIANGTENRLF